MEELKIKEALEPPKVIEVVEEKKVPEQGKLTKK